MFYFSGVTETAVAIHPETYNKKQYMNGYSNSTQSYNGEVRMYGEEILKLFEEVFARVIF